MKSLNLFESNLNRILRCFLGRLPLAEVLPLLVRQLDRPKCLSRDCVELIKDTLAKGCTERLAHFGWQRQRYLQDESAVSGRLWQRHQPQHLALTFSPHTLELLIHLTATDFSRRVSKRKRVIEQPLSHGDQLFAMFVYDLLRDTLGESVLINQPLFGHNPLVWLMFLDHAAGFKSVTARGLDWDPWFSEGNAWILESLQRPLVDRWQSIEIQKRNSSDQDLMSRIGNAQRNLIRGYLDAADQAGRRDLARFLIAAIGGTVQHFDEQHPWFSRLRIDSLRMAERAKFYQTVLSPFHSIQRLADWQQQAINIGFYDEGYRASQFWKSEWDAMNGEQVCRRARQLIQSVTPL